MKRFEHIEPHRKTYKNIRIHFPIYHEHALLLRPESHIAMVVVFSRHPIFSGLAKKHIDVRN